MFMTRYSASWMRFFTVLVCLSPALALADAEISKVVAERNELKTMQYRQQKSFGELAKLEEKNKRAVEKVDREMRAHNLSSVDRQRLEQRGAELSTEAKDIEAKRDKLRAEMEKTSETLAKNSKKLESLVAACPSCALDYIDHSSQLQTDSAAYPGGQYGKSGYGGYGGDAPGAVYTGYPGYPYVVPYNGFGGYSPFSNSYVGNPYRLNGGNDFNGADRVPGAYGYQNYPGAYRDPEHPAPGVVGEGGGQPVSRPGEDSKIMKGPDGGDGQGEAREK